MPISSRSHRKTDSNKSAFNQPAALNSNLDNRLLAYIATASAAGVSALALAPQANAKVIFTKTNETIVWNTTTLNLDNDGKPEFKFLSGGLGREFYKAVAGYKVNHVVLENDLFASALAADVTVGRGLKFGLGADLVSTSISSRTFYGGPWANVKNRFLGLEFRLSDGVHFGWARITLTTGPVSATLTGYAYETIPEKAIITGRLEDDDAQVVPQSNPASGSSFLSEQPTLGLLAVGAPTLAIWRREEDAAAN